MNQGARLKIVYLHQYFNTPAMPGGTRSFEMARRLVAAGHDVELVTTWRDCSAQTSWYVTREEGITVHWLPIEYSNHMNFVQRVRAFLRFAVAAARKAASINGDVVFATSTPLTIAIPGIYAAWRQRRPFVFEVRDMWPAVPIAMGVLRNLVLIRAAQWLERFAYRRAQHIVALAPGMRDDIVATGVDPSKVTVIPNGCDFDLFGSEMSCEAQALRSRFSWLEVRRLVVFAGTLGRANGVDYLVQIAVEMRRLNPEVRFAIIGDGSEKPSIESEAKQAGVLETNFFMLPAMPKKDLAVWLAAADFTVGLFAGPRVLWKDAVQNKFFDALAAGKPMACNFRGFQSELAVEHGVGVILHPENAAAAAAELNEKLCDSAWLSDVRGRATALAKGRFSRDRLARDLENVLGRAVSMSRR